jgi:hypothetical protein
VRSGKVHERLAVGVLLGALACAVHANESPLTVRQHSKPTLLSQRGAYRPSHAVTASRIAPQAQSGIGRHGSISAVLGGSATYDAKKGAVLGGSVMRRKF